MHVAIDDATRLAYVEVLGDERAPTAVAFLGRAIAHYASHGIKVERVITDNGGAYRSTIHAIACRAMGVRHLRTRPTTDRTADVDLEIWAVEPIIRPLVPIIERFADGVDFACESFRERVADRLAELPPPRDPTELPRGPISRPVPSRSRCTETLLLPAP